MTTPAHTPAPARALALLLTAAAAAACAQEQRVVRVKGILEGLPGVEGGWREDAPADPQPAASPAGRTSWDRVLAAFPDAEPPDPDAIPEAGGLRLRHPDGRVTLVSQSPADVMFHVMTTLRNKEHDLLLEQVIAQRTKQEYLDRGRDPMEAVRWLERRQDDITALFLSMPMAENTPGVDLEPIGRNAFRMRAPVFQRQDLRLTSFDVVIERGRFRLLHIR